MVTEQKKPPIYKCHKESIFFIFLWRYESIKMVLHKLGQITVKVLSNNVQMIYLMYKVLFLE